MKYKMTMFMADRRVNRVMEKSDFDLDKIKGIIDIVKSKIE